MMYLAITNEKLYSSCQCMKLLFWLISVWLAMLEILLKCWVSNCWEYCRTV